MDWEDVFTAVREETGPGQLYCLGFPRIVKDIFLGNISAARVACAEMQLRRPEIEEVYMQNCVGYRLANKKMEPEKREGDSEIPEACDYSKKPAVVKEIEEQEKEETLKAEEERERHRLYYRMTQKKIKRPKDVSWNDLSEWIKKNHPELLDENYNKKAPMTPPSPKTPATSIGLPAPPADRPVPAAQTQVQTNGNGFNFEPVVVSVSGTFTLEQLRLIKNGLVLLSGRESFSEKEKQEISHMIIGIGSLLN
jgi:hypothetical protein